MSVCLCLPPCVYTCVQVRTRTQTRTQTLSIRSTSLRLLFPQYGLFPISAHGLVANDNDDDYGNIDTFSSFPFIQPHHPHYTHQRHPTTRRHFCRRDRLHSRQPSRHAHHFDDTEVALYVIICAGDEFGCCRLGSDVNDGALGGVRAGAQTLDILSGQYRLRLVSDVLYLDILLGQYRLRLVSDVLYLDILPGQYRLRLVSDVLYLDILPGQYRLRLVSDVVYYWYLSIGSCLRKH